MFNEKTCKKCKKSIKKTFDFCPYCGKATYEEKDWGMLGKDDFTEKISQPSPFSGGFLNNIIGSAMKMVEQEMQKNMKEMKTARPKAKLQLYINGKRIDVEPRNNQPKKIQIKKERKKITQKSFSKENSKKFSILPKEEPKTNVKRLSDRIIYEIEMEDVKSINDVSITQLESSIEIKAVGKEKSYYKTIPIALPIIDYYFEDKKLILELELKE